MLQIGQLTQEQRDTIPIMKKRGLSKKINQ